MGSYYRIAPHYALRGWDKLPYALVDTRTGSVTFLRKSLMQVLMRCDGNWDFDSLYTNDQDREFASTCLAKGIIRKVPDE